MKQLYSIILLLIFSSAWSQEYQKHWDMIESGDYMLSQIQEEAERYFEGKDKGKGSGYKQWKRWEYFAMRDVTESDRLQSGGEIEEEVNRFNRQKRANNEAGNTTGNWEELGLTKRNPTTSWNPGVGRVECISVDPNDPNHILLGLPTGGAWSTKTGGNDWKPLTDFHVVMNMRGVAISPHNSNVYFLGTTYGIFKSNDQGSTWKHVVTSGTYIKILPHPTDPNIVLASGSGGIYRSTNGGESFKRMRTGNFDDMVYKPTNPNVMYATDRTSLYKSSNNGQSWSKVTTGGSGRGRVAVTKDDPNYVYYMQASGNGFGKLYRSTNDGQTFSARGNHSKDYLEGYAWYGIDLAISDQDKNLVYLGGMELFRSTNGGQTLSLHAGWNYASNKTKYIHADIHCLEWNNTHLYTGTDGGISIDHNNGASFNELSTSLGARQFYKIGVSQTDMNIVSGGSQDNGTAVMKGDKHKWYEWLGADGMETFVDWSNPNVLYGTSQNGTLYKSTNGGQSYQGLNGPGGKGLWVTPFEQDPKNANTIYVGINGISKKVGNGGWKQIFSLSLKPNEFKIAKSNNQIIYAAVGSRLYRTTNGGTSWSTMTGISGNVNYITIHPSDPNYVAVATTGGSHVYITKNGGQTWTGHKKNLPNITAECVLFQDGDEHGLYVGMSRGIYYIEDSKTEWQAFSDNLPLLKVSELEINYKSKKLFAGTYGRGLWSSDLYGEVLIDDDVALTKIVNADMTRYCASTIDFTPKIEVMNLGLNTLKSFTIQIKLDGVSKGTYTYSGNLLNKNLEEITLNAINGIGEGNHTLTFTAVKPNGVPDQNPANNEVTYLFEVVDGTKSKLTIVADKFPKDISWKLDHEAKTIYTEDYSQAGLEQNATITSEFCLATGCYDFTILDAYGDGLNEGGTPGYNITSLEDGKVFCEDDG